MKLLLQHKWSLLTLSKLALFVLTVWIPNSVLDEDVEESFLGGESQVMFDICDRAAVLETRDEKYNEPRVKVEDARPIGDPNVKSTTTLMNLDRGAVPAKSKARAGKCDKIGRIPSKVPIGSLTAERSADQSPISKIGSATAEKSADPSEISKTNAASSNGILKGERALISSSVTRVDRQEMTVPKKVNSRNIVLVGKTTDKIRRGETGKTTFGALDLHLPQDFLSLRRRQRKG